MQKCSNKKQQVLLEDRLTILTDKGHHQDSQDDPEGITKEVHENDREKGDGQVKLRSPFLILASTENLN